MSFVKKSIDWSIVLASAAVFLGVMYWGFCDFLDGKYINPVLEMGHRSITYSHNTTKEFYKPGEMVYARIMFHKNRDLRGIIQWNLVNGTVLQYPERAGGLPLGVWDHVVRVEQIPPDTRPGEFWFAGTVRYQPNWIGRVIYPLWTNRFKVVK